MKQFKASLIYYKLAIIRCVGKSLMAGITSLVATLNGVSWSEFSETQKFVAMATAGGSMWLTIDAFLDQSMSRLTAADKGKIASETTVAPEPEPAKSGE